MLNLSIQLPNNYDETETGGLSFKSLHLINCNEGTMAKYNKTLLNNNIISFVMFINSSTRDVHKLQHTCTCFILCDRLLCRIPRSNQVASLDVCNIVCK